MPIRSILVATDLSAREDGALLRARQLALQHAAALRLMYVAPHGEAPTPRAGAHLATLARQLEDVLQLPVGTTSPRACEFEDLALEARQADLVVLPHRRERSTAAFFRGQPVMRLLRASGRPVLVSRAPGDAAYARVLVPVNLSARSQALAAWAAAIQPGAQLQVFHVLSTRSEARLRAAEATEQAVHAYRARCTARARQGLQALAATLQSPDAGLLAEVGHGDPGRQIVVQQSRTGAGLVVLGKRRSAAWEDFLCGSVAHRVLSWGLADVLVVPDDFIDQRARALSGRVGQGGTRTPFGLPVAARRTP